METAASNSVSLSEVIVYLKQSGRTGRLLVRVPTEGNNGAGSFAPLSQLLFDGGQLIDARSEQENGDDLVYRLLSTHNIVFNFSPLEPEQLPDESERNIGRLQLMLLLAAIGALAEDQETEEEAAPATVIEVQHPLPELPSEPLTRIRSFRRRNRIPLPPGTPIGGRQALDPGSFELFLERLAEQQHSGYVSWLSDTAEGTLLLYRGQVVDAFWCETGDNSTFKDAVALDRFARATGNNQLRNAKVFSLNSDLVWAYTSVAYGTDKPQEQSLSAVDISHLLERLARRQHTGCIKTVAGNKASYIFMCRGMVLGDFEALADSLAPSPGHSMVLVLEPGSLVDIYTSPTSDELQSMNQTSWTPRRVALELQRVSEGTLGDKSRPIVTLFADAGEDPTALRIAATRAKLLARSLIEPAEHKELSANFDTLLRRLR